MDNLLNQPWVGFSWEGWIIEQIMIFLNNHDMKFDGPYYCKTNGFELDLILNISSEIWAIEIKLTSSPKKQDLEKLRKTGHPIKADKMALISKTRKTITGDKIFLPT